MMADWMKLVRTKTGVSYVDTLNGGRVSDGTLFQVRFPNNRIITLPAINRRRAVLIDVAPYIAVQETVYFAVPFEGLREIWMRAIDVDVQAVAAAKKPKKPVKKPAKK